MDGRALARSTNRASSGELIGERAEADQASGQLGAQMVAFSQHSRLHPASHAESLSQRPQSTIFRAIFFAQNSCANWLSG